MPPERSVLTLSLALEPAKLDIRVDYTSKKEERTSSGTSMTLGGPTSGFLCIPLIAFASRVFDPSTVLMGLAKMAISAARSICVMLASSLCNNQSQRRLLDRKREATNRQVTIPA